MISSVSLDDHRTRPDDGLQNGGQDHQLALGVHVLARITRADEDMRQHDGPADCAGERIAQARAVGHPAVRARVGQPIAAVLPDRGECRADRTAEAGIQAGSRNDPEQGDEKKSLHGVGQGDRFHAAQADVEDDGRADDADDRPVIGRASGGDLGRLTDRDQHGRDIGEG